MRQLAFASSALVGTNLIGIYYFLSINVVFGLVALILALAARFGGADCAAAQPKRALYLMLQIIPLVLMVVQSFHVLFYIRVKGKDWANATMDESDSEEEGEEY